MLSTMAFSETQLTALETAIAQGVTSVHYGDRQVTYRSTNEMIRLRNTMRAELGLAVPDNTRSRILTVATGKGL